MRSSKKAVIEDVECLDGERIRLQLIMCPKDYLFLGFKPFDTINVRKEKGE